MMEEEEDYRLVLWMRLEENEVGDKVPKILDPYIAELIMQPMKFVGGDGTVEIIEKDIILCDTCNAPWPELVLKNDGYLSRTVCMGCKDRYYPDWDIEEPSVVGPRFIGKSRRRIYKSK